jgi:uncharacterized protein (AIM24 family)
MLKLETLNELTLKVTCDGNGTLFTKKGAWIGGEYYGQTPFRFEKVLLGPQSNLAQAAVQHVMRRFTGENLELAKVSYGGQCITYFADLGQHVTVLNLSQGQVLSVESENLLAFTDTCDYSVRFIGVGVVSQKGLATSTLKGMGPNAQVAILTDGNPIVLSNMQNGSVLRADPDAAVCWLTNGVYDPQIKFDFNLKTLIPGQTSGETYQFEFARPTAVVIQHSERTSGIDIGMDGSGGKPTKQDNHIFRQDGNQMFNNLGNMGNGSGGNSGLGGLGNLGGIIGGIMNS